MDPTRRLQVLNQSSPSLRVAAGPAQQQNLSVASPSQDQPRLFLGGQQVTSDPSSNNAANNAQPQSTGNGWDTLVHAGEDLARPTVATAMNWAQFFGNLGTRAAGGKAQTGEQFWQGPGTSEIAKMAGNGNANNLGTTRNVIGNAAQVGLTGAALAAAPFTGGESLAAEAALSGVAGAGLGAANTFTNSPQASAGDYAKSAGIGGVLGAVAAPLTALGGKALFALRGGEAGAADRLVSSLVNSDSEETIAKQIAKAIPGADTDMVNAAAKYAATEKNPDAIRAVLDHVQSTTASGAPTLDPTVRSATRPNPDSVPDGYHVEGAPDPQQIANEQAVSKAADEAQAAVKAKLANEAKSGSEAAAKLPPGDVAAIKEAGGSVADAGATTIAEKSPQSLEAALNGVAASKDPTEISKMVDEILPNINAEQKAELVDKLVKSDNPDTVVQHLSDQMAKADGIVSPETPSVAPENASASTAGTATSPEAQKIEQAVAEAPTQSGTADGAVAADGSVSSPVSATTTPLDTAAPEAKDAAQQVMDSLDKAQAGYDEAAAARSGEKSVRIARAGNAYEDAGGGTQGIQAKLANLKGKYTESGFNPIEIAPDAKKALYDSIEQTAGSEFDKLNTQVALGKIFGDVAGKPTPSDINLLRAHFGDEFASKVEAGVAPPTGMQQAAHIAGEVAGLPKSIMASYDLSGTLRQGGILGSRFPKELANAFTDQVKYFASTQAFKDGMAEVAGRETYPLMLKGGLAVDGARGLTNTEEQFVSNLAEKIPGFGRGVAASDRAYTGFLTKLRADTFDKIVGAAQADGTQLSDKAIADISKFINTASGRGDLGMLEQHSQTLSTALFSPRLWKSRLDMLNPVYYAKLDPVARKYALQTAGTFATEVGAVLGLATLAGASVETDARSSDFLKMKVGNTRYDILGGLQQNLVFAWREISGEKKNSETGVVTSLSDGKFGAANRMSAASDFVQNKENPLLAAGQRILQGKDRGGNPVNPLAEIAKLAVPLPFSGAYEATNDVGSLTSPKDWAKGIAMNVPDTFGVSAQTYGTIKSKDKGPDGAVLPGHEQAIPTYAGKIEPNMVTDSSGKVIQDAKGKPITVTFPKGATDLEKQAMIDEKRTSAVADQFKAKLSTEDQALLKLQPKQLEDYRKSGKITQDQFDHIQQTSQDIKNLDGVETPEGATSPAAQAWFKKYNSLTTANQKKLLDSGTPDANDQTIADQMNQQRSKGLGEYKASPKLSKAYAEFENDINTHSDPNDPNHYTQVDLRNKAKSFQTFAYKQNYNQDQNDIYNEGPSADLKTLIRDKQIPKPDLDAAMKMDEELFNSGLTSSLKFTKKFRESMGYNVPTGAGGPNAGSGSGSGGSGTKTNAALTALLPTFKNNPGGNMPTFSAMTRSSAGNPRVSFKAPAGVVPGNSSSRVMIAPYRTKTITRLRNSVNG